MSRHKNKDRKLTRHHLIPKERKKLGTARKDISDDQFNRILWLWDDSHEMWHKLFKNLTIDEIILLLQRIKRLKHI